MNASNLLAIFLENHGEPRVAVTFPPGVHEAAAVIAYLAPELRCFRKGQFEGRTKRISPFLRREPDEPVNRELKRFYEKLLSVIKSTDIRDGRWQLLDCAAACAVDNQSRCHVPLPFADQGGKTWSLRNLLGSATQVRDGDGLVTQNLLLDMKPMRYHAFEISQPR